MSERTPISGVVEIRDAQGELKNYPYTASYSAPTHDEVGMLSLGWTAEVEGTERQPRGSLFTVRTDAVEIAPAFVKRQIERRIVEQLEGGA